VDPAGKVHLVAADMVRPNGIALSPDETVLYVSNADPALVRRYPVAADGSTGTGVEFARTNGGSDGMAVDDAGNLYATVNDGIQIFRPDGREWGTVQTPKRPANCTFGDADRKTLYITARESLYRVRMEIPGLP
jgi:gluconolactonase